jgi:regulator of sigma E protease
MDFLDILKAAGLLIAALSILVTWHELGHYLPAKLFKMRVDKFFLFFDWPR